MYKKLLALVASGERNSVLRERSRRETSSASLHAFEFEQCESISYSKKFDFIQSKQLGKQSEFICKLGISSEGYSKHSTNGSCWYLRRGCV